MNTSDSVEGYIEEHEKWTEGLLLLRDILLATTLEETFKWRSPVYTISGKNVVGLGAFKHHFGIWFFNGVFLKDEQNLLEQAQDKTKALRQMRFTAISEINKDAVRAYVQEAIENQKLEKQIKPKKQTELIIPEPLLTALNTDLSFKKQFNALTPYKQREYAEYIKTAKRDSTKRSRLEKIKPIIFEGKGLNDKYKNC